MSLKEQYYSEAILLAKYLLSVVPSEKEKELFYEAMLKLNIELNKKEKKIWDFTMNYPFTIGSFDAALALKNPDGNIRKKIFIMLAILETNKDYASYFLPKKFNFQDYFKIVFTGFRSAFRLISGLILLSFF